MNTIDNRTDDVDRWLVMWRFNGKTWTRVRVIPGLTWFSRIARSTQMPRLNLPKRSQISS